MYLISVVLFVSKTLGLQEKVDKAPD